MFRLGCFMCFRMYLVYVWDVKCVFRIINGGLDLWFKDIVVFFNTMFCVFFGFVTC